MGQATQDADLIAAQGRLLQKRAALNQMENRGQRIESINEPIMVVVENCKKAFEANPIRLMDEPKEEPREKSIQIIDGLPRSYQDCSFETYQGNDKLVDDLKRLAAENIVLRGNTGCGKTHLAIAIAKTIKTEMRQIRSSWEIVSGSMFTTAPELLLKIRSSFREDSKQSEEQLIDYYSMCDLLILDDLGSEKTTEFAVTTLYIILDRRIRECRKTIITTNLSQIEIEQTFGARIASRLSSMENIKINMPDYRKKRG